MTFARISSAVHRQTADVDCNVAEKSSQGILAPVAPMSLGKRRSFERTGHSPLPKVTWPCGHSGQLARFAAETGVVATGDHQREYTSHRRCPDAVYWRARTGAAAGNSASVTRKKGAVRGGWARPGCGWTNQPTGSQTVRRGAPGRERVADSGVSLAL